MTRSLARALALLLLLLPACGGDDGAGGAAVDTAVGPADTGGGADGAFVEVGGDTGAPGPDTAAPDTLVPDTAGPPPDTGPPAEGELGAPCAQNVDCFSGWCIAGPEGDVCTKTCGEADCPEGWACKTVITSGTDVASICVPFIDRTCAPCSDPVQCGGGACLAGADGGRCAAACEGDEDCGEGFTCAEVAGGEPAGTWCQPVTGSCLCRPGVDGGQRSCSTANEVGECFGVQTCAPETGWGPCSAPAAVAEDCDGQDNDCNGLVDDGLEEGDACENAVEGLGACPGTRVCFGPQGWVCSGPQPQAETCNFLDDDCDGLTDEDFKEDGAYASFDHCGTCNASCGVGYPNAAATACSTTGPQPQCVVTACEDGYVQINAFQCIPDVGNLCSACATDDNCLGAGSACVPIGGGLFCGKACESELDCPAGYACSDVGKPSLQCVPASGSCDCDGSNTDLSRSCKKTFTPPDASQPAYTCTGSQQCTADGWGDCQLPEEVCDGQDNDCSGGIDEPFKDAGGLYASVQHCGACGISCLGIQVPNASPTCLTSGPVPACSFDCADGYFDVNGISDDGCECAPTPGPDLAGDGVDSDCDGIDGQVDLGVFVAKNGDDAAPGTLEAPMLTLGAALERAWSTGKRDVYVATGVYSENVVLREGLGLFGGYSGDFTLRDTVVFETAILGVDPTPAAPGAVTAVGLGPAGAPEMTRLDGFTIFGPNVANEAGANSYAVYLRNCGPMLQVRNNRVFGGAGGNGAAGTPGGDGLDGVDGGDGAPVTDVGKVDGSGNRVCDNATDAVPGGGGGARVCGDGATVSGGAGGNGRCPTFEQAPAAAEQGKVGKGTAPGAGGQSAWDLRFDSDDSCGLCTQPSNLFTEPTPGLSGAKGPDGPAGPGCLLSAGSVQGGAWVGGLGGTGAAGNHGSGGGGGGAGGGVQVDGTACTGCSQTVAADCCTPKGTPSCSDAGVTACVCLADLFCCTSSWDATCVQEVSELGCGSCPGLCGDDIGGTGGGGGSGGCLGSGGTGGAPGGGSFGVFIVFDAAPSGLPSVVNNTVRAGSGGAGGAGGPGGAGGNGGSGGGGGPASQGDDTTWCASGGGEGGNGGRGGHGGGGGGACGGASFGVFVWPIEGAAASPTAYKVGNTFLPGGQGGQGGPGGASLGLSGGPGAPGASGSANF